MWMVKASTQRPELVQMFEVALSRRICCSRVESVSTIAAPPFGIDGLAAEPSGHLAQIFRLRGEQADIGPAIDRGRCRSTGLRRPRCRRPWRPAAETSAERHGLGEHGDQQRALGAAGFADRRAGRADCRRHPASAPRRRKSRASIWAMMSSLARTSGASVSTLSPAMARERPRPPRRNGDAGRPTARAFLRRVTRCAISTASPVAVEPSYIEALATSMPVSSATCVWNSKRYCSVPCAISG